ncbi:hypothetical protein PVAP13_9KG291613 [Panicum virgatum]|uniref:Uncharacterized protein n=1 Tax=Panicum virgatum TaxID=38727 RepID=A0A8T0NI74_PANVG|nr:hypothetical protein PVAP13_9KG291613 [Panicum virgatum]
MPRPRLDLLRANSGGGGGHYGRRWRLRRRGRGGRAHRLVAKSGLCSLLHGGRLPWVSAAVPPPFSRARRLYPRLAPSPPRLAPPPASTRSSPRIVILDRAVAVTGAPHFAFARPCPQHGPPHQRERRGGGRRALPRRRIQIHERWAATAVAIVASVATAPANQRRRASEAELSDLASATRGARGLLLGCVAEEGVEGAGHGKVPGQLQLADGSDDGRVRPLLVASPRTPAPATEFIPSASTDHAGGIA